MPDDPLPPAATSSQRRLVAMLGAAALLGSLSLAFVLGGKKAPPPRDLETYIEIGRLDGSSIDLNTQATPDNWVDNTVPGAEVAAAAPATDPPSTQRSSALIQGDGTGTGAQAQPSVASVPSMPVEAEPHAAAVDANNVPGIGTQAPSKPATATTGSAPVAQTAPKSGTIADSDKAGTPTTSPATTTAGSAPLAQVAPKSGTTGGGSDKTGEPTTRPASTSVTPQPQASSPAAPHAIPVKVARVVAEEHASPAPAFVRPAQKRSGVVAQTRTLITEKQYAPPSASKAPRPAGEEKTTGSAPARVRQQEARSYAQQATQQMREQKALPPNLQVRLPRRAETTNPAVWHEDDTPATADERRPFGLVVVEEKPDLTPEGIPLRTDIPAGTSPLQQNGPDKPLWKRPK